MSLVDDGALVVLAEMFPDQDVEMLSRALVDSNNDVNLACSILLSSQIEEEKQDPLGDLIQLFPDISQDEIERIYNQQKDANGDKFDANDVVLDLLSYEAIRQHQAKSEIDTQTNISDSQWDKTKDNVNMIMKLTDVSKEDANKYYTENLFNVSLAIISIIKDSNSDEVKPIIKKAPKPKRVGGKVQGHHGLAHVRKTPQPNKENSFEHLSINDMDDKNEDVVEHDFKLTPEEEILIDTTIENNTMLNSINPQFLKKALDYYKGDKKKLLKLIQYITEAKATKLTFITKSNNPTINIKDQFNIRTTSVKSNSARTNNNDTIRSNLVVQGRENSRAAQDMLSNFFVDYKLDFHGFLPQEARKITDLCLTKWWNREMEEREMNKGKMSLTATQFMHPVTIVTGRGIHSSGGFSKVRASILNYLQQNNYVFDENPSYFVVTGRKRAAV